MSDRKKVQERVGDDETRERKQLWSYQKENTVPEQINRTDKYLDPYHVE